ncbi:MAG: hypothetical protein KFW21_04790 [Spirochaetota bacterium]|nr:hypothetical protein [Spirochaetota bacterium]
MTLPRPQQYSPLSLFLTISLGIHFIALVTFSVFSPKFIKIKNTNISIQINDIQNQISSPLQEIPTPIIPQTKPTIPKKVAQTPVQTKPTIPKKVAQTPIQTKPTIPKKVAQTPVQTQIPVLEVPTPELVQIIQSDTVESIPNPTQQLVDKTKDISDTLDNLLNQKTQKKASSDVLADAQWSGTPRKTLLFPNLIASIPQQYKSRGYGFSITAKITFSPQGWVSAVELLRTSGDPRIDSIFRTELRKIRIEPSSKTSYDTITKTFTISVK